MLSDRTPPLSSTSSVLPCIPAMPAFSTAEPRPLPVPSLLSRLQRLQKLVETLTVTQLETLTVVKRLEEQIQSLQKPDVHSPGTPLDGSIPVESAPVILRSGMERFSRLPRPFVPPRTEVYGDESCVVPDPTFSIWSNGVLLEENVLMDSRASTPTTPMPTSSASVFPPYEPTAPHPLDQAHPLYPSNPVVLQTRPPPVVVETKDTIREGLFSELLDRITRRAKARNDVVRYQRRERMQKYSEEGLEEDYSGDFEYGSEDKMPVLVEGRVDGYGEEDEETDEEMPALVYVSSFVERSTLPLNVNKTDPPTLSGLEGWPLSEIDLHWIPPLCYPGDWVHPDHVYPPSLTDSPLPWIVVDSDEAVYSDGSEELDPGSPSYLDSSIAVDGSTRGWLGVNWRKVVESGEGDEREVSWLEIIE